LSLRILAIVAAGLITAARADLRARERSAGEQPNSGVVQQEQVDRIRRDAAVGIRKLAGRHLTLWTDLPPDAEVDSLPKYFDQAVSQWTAWFGIAADRVQSWHVTGYVMGDKRPFEQAGLLTGQVPSFEHGFSLDGQFWLFEQPSPYYRRHLLLHEGTHVFMNRFLESCGPAWYMEGVAELLATHTIRDGALKLLYFPKTREEAPYWGRIKMVRDTANDGPRSIDAVLELRPATDRLSTDYGWCWALAAFLDGHPRYRDRFRHLIRFVDEPNFNEHFRRLYAADWSELELEWALFVADLDYGCDLARAAIQFTPRQRGASDGVANSDIVDAAGGWQASRFHVQRGKTYRLQASGRYQIANGPPPWFCEPDGVSITYHRGQPAGRLLAAVKPDDPSLPAVDFFLHPTPIGREGSLRAAATGTLYLKINESAAKLGDNRGTLTVKLLAP
jgi:hypothetical protein